MATGSAYHQSARNRTSGQPFIIAGLDLPLDAEFLGDEFEEGSRAVRWWQSAAASTADELGGRGIMLVPRGQQSAATSRPHQVDELAGVICTGAGHSGDEGSSAAGAAGLTGRP